MTEANAIAESTRDERVFFVKLVTGEDLFARLLFTLDGALCLENPMIIEAVEHQGSKQMLMTRYAPYVATPLLISEDDTVICQPVTESMSQYYLTCLDFHQKEADQRREHAVGKAVQAMKQESPRTIADFNERLLLSSLALITESKN